jgi:hypothetical protein
MRNTGNSAGKPHDARTFWRLAAVCAWVVWGTGCVSLSPEAAKVRMTSNPEVVRSCQFVQSRKPVLEPWSEAAQAWQRDET